MSHFPIADDPLRGSRRLLKRLTARRGPDHLPGEQPCRILIGGDVDAVRLAELVAGSLGTAAGSELRFGGLAVEVGPNAHAGAGDAGRWPLAVELRPAETVPHAAYVETVTAILRGAWAGELRAAALCPFADELPRADGGSERRHTRNV